VGLAIDSSNNIWVVEVSGYDVKEYSSSGTLLGTFGSKNSSCNISQSSTWVTGEFCSGYGPQFTAIDSSGNIWVTDNQPYEIQQFSSTSPYNYAGKVSSPSTGIQGIAADSSGHIFLADKYSSHVYKFSATSPYSGVNSFNSGSQNYFGGTGNGAGLFNGLIDVSVDSSGNIWALDTTNKNVQKCSSTGSCGTPISSFNTGDSFNAPIGVTVVSR
jgi:sugar lactone lactonase YvrE